MSNDTISTRIVFEVDRQSASESARVLNEARASIEHIREASEQTSSSALRLAEAQRSHADEIRNQLQHTVEQIGKLDSELGGLGEHYEQAMISAHEIAEEMLALQEEISITSGMGDNEQGFAEAGAKVAQLRQEYDQLKHILSDIPRDIKDSLQGSNTEASRGLNETTEKIYAVRDASNEAAAASLRLKEARKFPKDEVEDILRKTVAQVAKLDASMGGIGDDYERAMKSAYEIADDLLELQDEIDMSYGMNNTNNEQGLTESGKRVAQLRREYDQLKHILADIPRELKTGLKEVNDEAEKLQQSLNVKVETTTRAGSARSNLSVISTLSNRVGMGSSTLNIAGDFIEIVDSLPNLKESLKGIPDSLRAAVSAIGTPFGLGMLGAMGALALGIKLFTDETRKREEEIARAREEARKSSQEAASTGIGVLGIVADVKAEGTINAADNAISNAQNNLNRANIFGDLLSPLIDEYEIIKDDMLSRFGRDDILNFLAGDFSSYKNLDDLHDKVFAVIDYMERLTPILNDLQIPIEEFLKDPEAGFEKLNEALKENQSVITTNQSVIDQINELYSEGYFVLETLEEVEKRLNEARLAEAERLRQWSLEEARLSRASATELEGRLQALNDDNESLRVARDALIQMGEGTESATKAIEDYNKQISDNEQLTNMIKDDYLEQARARELADEVRKESVDAVIKYNRDVEAVNRQYQDARLASEQKLTDDLLRIDDRRIQAIEKAQQQLAEREQLIALKAARDEEDQSAKLAFDRQQQAVKIEREELKAEMDHARKVRDIREKSAEQETILLLKRDFAGLFALRQQTDKDIKKAERSALEASELRDQSRDEQQQDEAEKLAFEREQRNIRYQREITDAHAQAKRTQDQARANYDRETQLLRDKHVQQLQDLANAKQAEMNLLNKSIADELSLLSRGRTARVWAEEETQAALAQVAQMGLRSRLGFGPAPFPITYSNPNVRNNNQVVNQTFTINESNNPARTRQIILDTFQQIWEH